MSSIQESDKPSKKALDLLESVYARLGPLLQDDRPCEVDFIVEMRGVCTTLMAAMDLAPDMLLATVVHQRKGVYTLRQAVDTAIVTDYVLSSPQVRDSQRESIMGAALTMNIGMSTLHEQLAQQSTALTKEQKLKIKAHPQEGERLLRLLGVSDSLWLDCVVQHHERADGSGYPCCLCGEDIQWLAQLLGIADRYCALLKPTAWRHAKLVDNALWEALQCAAGEARDELGELFARRMGVYPAGALVQLVNGDIGIVWQQGQQITTPKVCVLFNILLDPVSEVIVRDTAEEDSAIVGVLMAAKMPQLPSLSNLWGMGPAWQSA